MAIVKYHNHMNEISFSKFKKKELDLFFSICHKLKEKGTNSVQLDFSELKELSSYTSEDPKKFIQDLKSTYDKMLKLDFTIGNDPLNFTKFNLFSKYTVSNNTKTVTIATNSEFSYILNEINPYTKFELLEFVSLKSSYSKNLFKKLKQYTRTYESDHKTLFWEVSIEEFRRLLDISDFYKEMRDINRRVLSPILKELTPYFKNLKIEKIKQGKSISKLKFTWEKQYESNNEIIDITISQELQDAFNKAQINRHIKEFLTEENKNKLIAAFEEKDLIRGLKYSQKNIENAFKKFSYLENSIKKGLEKPIIKTTVVKTTVPEEGNIILGEQLIIKTKVTQEQFDILLEKELKGIHKDNLKRNPYFKDHTIRRLEKEFEIIKEIKNIKQEPSEENVFIKTEKVSSQILELNSKLEKKREELEKTKEETDPQLKIFLDLIEFKIKQTKEEINDKSFWIKRKINLELEELEENLKKFYNLIESCNIENMDKETINSLEKFTKYFEDYFNIKL